MNIRSLSLFTISAVLLTSGFLLLNDSPKENYFPRANSSSSELELFRGHADYMNSIRNNRTTGFVSTREVQDALTHAGKMKKNDKALDITWRFKGPDNVGGRTRALLIDRNDTLHIIAGGIAGGLWESFNGAVTWQPYDLDFKIRNVSSIAQGSDGVIYVGTGAQVFERASNNNAATSTASGTGIYKLTGNGNSELLAGPISDFDFNTDWSSVYGIAVSPSNPQRVYAATNRGLRQSIDGGQSWTNANTNNVTDCQDVLITSDEKIFVSHSNVIYVSTDNGATFSSTNFSGAGRIELAIAPSNTDIAYASIARTDNCLLGVYRTNNAGSTWDRLENTPDYFTTNASSCQGDYDNAIVVFPNDAGKIIVGGIGLFQWDLSSVDPAPVQGEWKSIAATNEFVGNNSLNPFYVHADKHGLIFHPTNPNKLYIISDGGIAYSENINSTFPTYGQNNLGYNVTQFYDIGVGPNDLVIGGTQDNGTQLMGLGFNTGKSSVEVRGNDGFDAELFTINPSLGIASDFFGNIGRVQGIGTSLSSSNFSNALITSGRLDQLCNGTAGGLLPGCSPLFYTNFAIWESFNYPTTTDSVVVQIEETSLPPLEAGRVIDYKSKNNSLPLKATLQNAVAASDTLIGDLDSNKVGVGTSGMVTFRTAYDTITVDTNTKTINFKYRSGGTETKSYALNIPVTYNNVFFPDPLSVTVTETEVFYTEPQIIFYYSFELPDLVQSMVALTNVRGGTDSLQRDIWMSRDVLKGGNVTEPRWIKISGTLSTPRPSPDNSNTVASAFSNDGDHFFYGTTQGNLYRIDNINAVDFSQIDVTESEDYTVVNTTSHDLIMSFGNRAITSIAIDPNNSDNVVVTLGNYGGAQYVQRSTNATGSSVSFVSLAGEGTNALPNVPVYEAIIDVKDNNRVLLATEIGVFGTENAFDTTSVISQLTGVRVPDVVWSEENGGMGRARVMAIDQAVFGADVGATNQGKVYIGTHGRGVFETDQLVGLEETNTFSGETKKLKNQLKVYPNPVKDNMNIELNVISTDIINVQVYTITGQLVREQQLGNVKHGKNTVMMNLSDLDKGTYIVRAIQRGTATTAKFVKQ